MTTNTDNGKGIKKEVEPEFKATAYVGDVLTIIRGNTYQEVSDKIAYERSQGQSVYVVSR